MDRREYRRRLAARPNSVRFQEIDRLLRLFGWELVTIRGSHHVYGRGTTEQVVIPRRVPNVLAVYVRRVLALTNEAGDD